MAGMRRLLQHLRFPPWRLQRRFPPAAMDALTQCIAAGERRHLGEVRLVLEGRLELAALWRGQPVRERAIEVFASLGVWDTEANIGVLIYVLMAERRIEIVADRGISRQVDAARWQAICGAIQAAFRQGRWQAGLEAGLDAVNEELVRHYPRGGRPHQGELPDRPVLL